VWNDEFLPVAWETVELSPRDAFRSRRDFRRLARRRATGSLRTTTGFVRHENVYRLLAYLGYSFE
jgi:hypothetical protein